MLSRTLSPTLPCGQAAGRQVTRHPIRLTGWRVPPASAAVALPSCRGVAPDMGRTVDLGGEPSSSEISNLMLSFHERCTAATQPFLTTAPGATEFGRHLSEDTKSSTSSPVIFSFSPEKSYGRHGQDKSRCVPECHARLRTTVLLPLSVRVLSGLTSSTIQHTISE